MKSTTNISFAHHATRIIRVIALIVLGLLSSQCTSDPEPLDAALSNDELYLVTVYKNTADAREEHSVNHLKSDSLFAWLDSTIDTTRIANTIRRLDEDPDRWLLVFHQIEVELNRAGSGGSGDQGND